MATLSVMRESVIGERRVAVVPTDIPRLASTGVDVLVESGAGAAAGHGDAEYEEAGAVVATGVTMPAGAPGLLVKVLPPTHEEAAALAPGSILVSFFPPAAHLPVVKLLCDRRVTALSFDLVPRISRAQAVDALSSQGSAAGYEAVILAAHRLSRMLPLMMTAAGTIPPARVLVIGAGVAGLQAVATARRLGASVSACDVRPEAAEEVRSLGARFVELPLEAQQGTGGYAAEQGEAFIARQQELVATRVVESDIVVTTAAVPGRPAPKLITGATISRMRRGSVIVDLAAATGGNTEMTRDGEEVEHNGVVVIGAGNLLCDIASSASALYSRNVTNLMALMVRGGEVIVDRTDEVLECMCLTAGGEILHEATRVAVEGLSA